MAILDLSGKTNNKQVRLAAIISTICSPILLIALAVLLVNFSAIKANPDNFIVFMIIAGLPASVLYIYPVLRKKRNIHLHDAISQRERNTLFIVTIFSLIFLSVIFSYEQLNNKTWADVAIILATYFGGFFIINMFFDKASQHAGSFVFSVLYLSSLNNNLLLLLAFLPAVIWSRLYLKRHTKAQILWGIAIGIFVGLLSLRV